MFKSPNETNFTIKHKKENGEYDAAFMHRFKYLF